MKDRLMIVRVCTYCKGYEKFYDVESVKSDDTFLYINMYKEGGLTKTKAIRLADIESFEKEEL